MIRYIKIEDNNKRDAEITFKSVRSGDLIYLALENGEKPINKRVIKSTNENSLEYLINKTEPTQDDYNNFSEILIFKYAVVFLVSPLSCLLIALVNGLNLVPDPPANIIPFISIIFIY